MSLASEDIKVAVIVPIFNVEQYLGECLDSIVAQSYKNIQAILVNDGSTDASSLAIAREYVAKHANFVLIDKPNLGLSSARNVALDFLSQSYKLQLDSNTEVTDLLTYKVINDNPYNIKGIYTSKDCIESKSTESSTRDIESSVKNTDSSSMNTESNTLKIPQIDYIIFLDSDDYWRSDCIESCVAALQKTQKENTKVEIVWFDVEFIFDGIEPFEWNMGLEKMYHLTTEKIISIQDFVKLNNDLKISIFNWVWMGMIDFNVIKNNKIRFLNKVLWEDNLFTIVLFSHIKYMYILPKRLIVYRFRQKSSSNHGDKQNSIKPSIPPYIADVLNAYNNDVFEARRYYSAASWFMMLIEVIKLIEANSNNPMLKLTREQFLQCYIQRSIDIIDMDKDPWNLKCNIPIIKDYIKNPTKHEKLAINYPVLYEYYRKIEATKLYKSTKALEILTRQNIKKIYNKITQIERNFRKMIKRKKS